MRLQANYESYLSFGFYICEIDNIIVLTSQNSLIAENQTIFSIPSAIVFV